METVYISDKRFIDVTQGDALQLWGPDKLYVVENCLFDNSGVAPDASDEACDVLCGGSAVFKQCRFVNWGKAFLAGNGEFPQETDKQIDLTFDECIFDGNSRRNPFIRYGKLTMHRCIIRNWGRAFHEKSFGIRVSDGARAVLIDVAFWQDHLVQAGMKNFVLDCARQPLSFSDWTAIFKPGATRGAYTETGGSIEAWHCYRNKFWISVEGLKSEMSAIEAESLLDYLETACPKR